MGQIIQYMSAGFLLTVFFITALCFGCIVGAWTIRIIRRMVEHEEKRPL